MTQAVDKFLQSFDGKALAGAGLDWLDEARANARRHFAAHGLPRAREEQWKYTAVRPIEKQDFARADAAKGVLQDSDLEAFTYPELDCARLVFENGRYRADLADTAALPGQVTCTPLSEAFGQHAKSLAPFFQQQLRGSAHGFAALNSAFSDEGLYVRVPAGMRVELPVLTLFASCAASHPVASHPRVILHLERDSELVWIENYCGFDENTNLTNVWTQIELEAGASLRHLRVQRDSSKSLLVNRTDINVQSGANYTGFAIDLGARLARHDLNVALNGEHAECALNGLYVIGARQHVDNHTWVDHAAPNTRSKEIYKGVLNDYSRAVFNGKVFVHQGCNGSDAAQTNANLLLSENAEIDTKPELQIHADDVKCTHGATIGQLDLDALFYLQTRGLDPDEARGLLTWAFCREVVDRLQIKAVRERLAGQVLQNLPSGLVAANAV